MDFKWDERNLRHVLVERPRGVNPSLVQEVGDTSPKLFPNQPATNRSGSHLMVGPNRDGRYWTIVLREVENDVWRPITGWPSTNSEIRLYSEAPYEQEP